MIPPYTYYLENRLLNPSLGAGSLMPLVHDGYLDQVIALAPRSDRGMRGCAGTANSSAVYHSLTP